MRATKIVAEFRAKQGLTPNRRASDNGYVVQQDGIDKLADYAAVDYAAAAVLAQTPKLAAPALPQIGTINGTGRAILDLTTLSATQGFIVQGDTSGDAAGWSVSSAGDVNGDGIDDLLITALEGDDGGTRAGEAYVVFGARNPFGTSVTTDGVARQVIDLTSLTAAQGFIIQGDVAGDLAGVSGTSAGDVNGDGIDDLIIGARYANGGGNDAGEAYVIFGSRNVQGASVSSGGFSRQVVDLTSLSAAQGFVIQGDANLDRAGGSVSAAGDLNGDGIDDIVVGARYGDDGGNGAGEAYVIFGARSGFGSSVTTGGFARQTIDLTSLTAAQGFVIQGDTTFDYAGSSVSSAGDVNGDGIDDLVVGGFSAGDGVNATGEAYVIFGTRSGFGTGTVAGGFTRQVIDLTSLTAAQGFIIQGDTAGDGAGFSVSSAGDVNGDGVTDLIVGAQRGDDGGTDAGEAYVIFGTRNGFGTSTTTAGFARQVIDLTTLSASQGFVVQGDASQDYAGFSVSSAGDINGDGVDDLIVGSKGADDGGTQAGNAYVIYGSRGVVGTSVTTAGFARQVIDVTTLAPTQGFVIQGDAAFDAAGSSVAAAGDVNADGIDDLIVGAPNGGDGGFIAGEAYVIFGEAAAAATPFPSVIDLDPVNFPATLGFKIQGEVADDIAGRSVSSAGDINGDGFGDLIIGASRNDSGGSNAGAAYVIFGGALGFGSLIDLANLSASTGFKIQGDVAGDEAGTSVSSAGDINGDGFGDLIVGAGGNSSGGSFAGAAYVIFGRASGFGSLIDLTGLSASDGFKIQGDAAYDIAGRRVSSAGDINGDGFADLIVGADVHDSGGNNAGAAYVIFGRASGFGSLIDLAGLSAPDGFKIQGDVAGDRAGISVSSAGDVNGDGFADLIVGAYENDSGGNYAGAAYVIFGRASGFGSLIDLTGLPASTGFKIQGDATYDQAGFSVSSAGDVNGDGFADMIVGAIRNDSGGDNAGAAYVIFGRASGFGSLIDLTSLSATDGFKILGAAYNDLAGFSVSSAGDVNGDGFADMIVGANSNGSGGIYAGAAYVIFGKASGFGSVIDLTNLTANDGFTIQGDAAYDRSGASVSSAGDVNGDGFADLIVGAYFNDGGGSNAGAAYVIFGHATLLLNQAPAGTDATLTISEDTPRTLTAADFGFSDTDGNSLFAVQITTLPTAGTLTLSGNTVTAGESIPVASLPNLVFTPALNANGAGYASFTFQVQDNGGTANGGVDLDASANTLTFSVTAVDDAPVAVADPANSVDENGSLAIAVLANDTDADGGTISVATINGSAATVGNAITLASGAMATLNADGTISYNPNSRFNSLVAAATATATGATNSSATDSFSYALNGGSSATVTVTINGVDGAGDQLGGSGASDTLSGSGGNDVLNLSQGGDDTASGGTGNDGFYFGAAFDGNDSVDGGAGTLDQVALQGDYSAGVTLGANSAVGIEQYVLLPGSNTRFGLSGDPTLAYNVITGDAAIATGQQLVFQANTLRAGESFTLDASGELDGAVFTYGGLGTENLRGSQNADAFFFGTGRFNAGDVVDGQGGVDQLGLQGTYSGANAVTFGAGQLLNVEMIVLLSNNDTRFGGAGSGTPYSYTLTMHDANVAAGATLTISANNLASDEVLAFDGSAELDGRYTIYSGNGTDSIIGGALADTISGRGGADNLTGGGGNDIFLYTNLTDSIATAQDHILDFTSGDIIDLSRLDAITGGTNNAFAFIGDAAFDNTSGQLRAVNTSGNDWLVEADVNGDGVADLSIHVTTSDADPLTAGDFVL